VHQLDAFLIVAYMAAFTGVNLCLSRARKMNEHYFIPDWTILGWATWRSQPATIINDFTFIAKPGSAYGDEWSMLVPGFRIVGALAFIGAVNISFFRQVIATSAYEYFGNHFGQAGKLVALGSKLHEFQFYAKDGIALVFSGKYLFYLRLGNQMPMQQERALIDKRKSK
jgi:Na+/proline symporter